MKRKIPQERKEPIKRKGQFTKQMSANQKKNITR